MPTWTRRLPKWLRPRKVFSFRTPRAYTQAETQITVIVQPDDLSLIVEEDGLEYTDYYTSETLVDELGEILVDENGEVLIATTVQTGNVYVVSVPPDDLSVVVEEDTR